MLNQILVSGKDFGLIIIGEYYNNIIQIPKLAIKIASKIRLCVNFSNSIIHAWQIQRNAYLIMAYLEIHF